jgi:hypothetical protein
VPVVSAAATLGASGLFMVFSVEKQRIQLFSCLDQLFSSVVANLAPRQGLHWPAAFAKPLDIHLKPAYCVLQQRTASCWRSRTF